MKVGHADPPNQTLAKSLSLVTTVPRDFLDQTYNDDMSSVITAMLPRVSRALQVIL